MDIRSTLSAVVMASATPLSSPAAGQPQAWLRELEQARWAAQPRYLPGTVHDAPAQHHESGDAHTRSASLGIARDHRSTVAGPPAHASTPPGTVSADPPQMPPARPASNAPATMTSPPLQTSATFILRESQRPLARLPACYASVPAPTARPKWAARHVHVEQGDGVLAVWVRDAQLDGPRARALAEQLALGSESLVARRAVRLVVNGHPVDARPAVPHPSSFVEPGAHRGS
jgi:hypothetical protein